jgi:hypothetical protein
LVNNSFFEYPNSLQAALFALMSLPVPTSEMIFACREVSKACWRIWSGFDVPSLFVATIFIFFAEAGDGSMKIGLA